MAKVALEKKAFEVIPQYMIQQNRPYSVVDVITNLHKEFGKALVVKVLDASVESGVLQEKAIGKQKIYYANQENMEKFDEGALAEIDMKIAQTTESYNKLALEWKEIQAELRIFASVETTAQLLKRKSETIQKMEVIGARVAVLEQTRDSASDALDGKALIAREKLALTEMNKRKRLVKDMFGAISENATLPKKKLVESIGLDMDIDFKK